MSSSPHRRIRSARSMRHCSSGIAMTSCLLCASLAIPLAGAQEPDRVYGGKIESEAKSAAVENCEYEELVEKQSCNTRLNKTRCIEEVIEACARRFAPADPETPPEGEAPVPPQP